jgi:predicted choloylglycine hydrolase
MNEHGLAACKASNGLPVGNFEGGQKAGVTGFQFWIVIRSILENCKDVKEAISFAMKAPIGYNINLMLADPSNTIALFQCVDGHKFYKILNETSHETFLSSTNHAIFPELKKYQKQVLKSSVVRNNTIIKTFEGKEKVSKTDIKNLLSASYPEGLCCHYYGDFFGTLRSMIFDVTDKTIEMTFGTAQKNSWHTFKIDDTLNETTYEMNLPYAKAPMSFYEFE